MKPLQVFHLVMVLSVTVSANTGNGDMPKELGLERHLSSASDAQCGTFTNSNAVRTMYLQSSTNWGECESYMLSISTSTSTIEANLGQANDAFGVVVKLTGSLKTSAVKVYSSAYSSLSKLQGIPKIGKIIKIMLQILDKAKKALEFIYKWMLSVEKIMDKLGTAFEVMAKGFQGIVKATKLAESGYTKSASLAVDSIECAKKTSDCADNAAVESYHSEIKSSASSELAASSICPKTLGSIVNTLKSLASAVKATLFTKIKQAVQEVERVLKPILKSIQDTMDEIKEHLNEAYCCATPYGLQVGFKVISQVLDLVTCPIDGAVEGIDAAIDALESELNNMIKMLLSKILTPVANIGLQLPSKGPGSLDPTTCTYVEPKVTIKKVYPFKPWVDALKYDKPSVTTFRHVAIAFGNEIVKACKEAAEEVGTKLEHDCCKDYRPLSDGEFCDPTGTTPYKKCMQCKSGTDSWWFSKSYHGCGRSPCGSNGKLCGAGTTCKGCCSGHSYWYGKAFTACGKEPCWGDGKRCALGTSCRACCNKATWWAKKVFTACGKEPCWADGKVCGAGTSCKMCCTKHTYWSSKAFTACGNEPCWNGGTRCLGGTSCKKCCRGSHWVWSKFGHFCK